MSANNDLFPCVRVEGAILPSDLLQRVAAGDARLEGLRPDDYHLVGKKVNEATSQAWTELSRVWEEFRPFLEKPASPADDSVTLKKWLLPFWQVLGYGQLEKAKPFEIDGKQYPISNIRYHSPIHLVGFRQDLDKRVETSEGKRPSPHGMVQEFLNRSDAHLWAFVSNGLKLRVLRDNIRLTRQAFVEFDLQAMFDGKAYADFALLWRLCHESRVNAERPEQCWLERWSKAAAELGLRALEQLRVGVERAIEALGRGFLHPRNAELIRWLRDREPHAQEYYRQLLRVVYRLLFLFVAEDRGLLFDPSAAEAARERYTKFYSTARLRRIAEQTHGTPHTDLYHALELVLCPLGRGGCPELGLSELGGLFDPAGTPNLNGCVIGNADLLEAVRALSIVSDGKSQRSVDYRNLGSEELGSVYESLLELKPQFTPDPPSFVLKTAAGNERKTTGSYYTPTSLITCLLDSALDPVLKEAAAKPDAEAAILNLKVCDPACGSGHFLIAAAHRIARTLAAVRTQEEEPAPDAVRHGLRDVIGRCVFGVDVNPMAVELCQVALWMEAMEPGKPLSFLKHRIQCGNSLLGTTPALLAKGVPDEAFEPIEGDDKAYCREWKKANKREREERRKGQGNIEDLLPHLGNFATEMAALDTLPDDTPEQVRAKAERYERLASESSYRTSGRFFADVWCAAFVWRKAKEAFDYPITERIFRQVERNPHDVTPWVYAEVVRLREQYQFFHWHLAFPGVFRPAARGENPDNELTGWCGGFNAVLGNPPWERIKLQEQEWFAAHGRPDIAGARTAAIRSKMIIELAGSDSTLYQAFLDDRRTAEGESHFVRDSNSVDEDTNHPLGLFPLCGHGDVNTYSLFAELNLNLISPSGRVGCIVPTGIATDDTTKLFFQNVVEKKSLQSYFGFKNERFLFPKPVEHTVTYGLLTLLGSKHRSESMEFCWNVWTVEEMQDPMRRIKLTADDIAVLNPNTRTCPVFRTARDAELTKAFYRRFPILIREGNEEANPWGIQIRQGFFHLTNDLSAGVLIERQELITRSDAEEWNVPVYEGKLIHQHCHRYASYSASGEGDDTVELDQSVMSPHQVVQCRYFTRSSALGQRIPKDYRHKWFLVYRDIARATDSRTCIAALVPRIGIAYTLRVIVKLEAFPEYSGCLCASLNSFVFDYVARQTLAGTHLSDYIFKQLPVLPPSTYGKPCEWAPDESVAAWIVPRVVELAYTAWDLTPFAEDCGYQGDPFRWDEDRRFQLRCELDAAFFHLYLGTGEWQQATGEPGVNFARLTEAFPTPRDAVEYVMETFPIVREHDLDAHGRYRTKESILEVYDALADAVRTGQPYRSPLNPPPADARCRHADREGTIAPGAVRTIIDLLTALPPNPFHLRLTEADLGPDQPKDWTCRRLTDGEPMPPEGTWVLLRYDGLRRGSIPLPIAAGKLTLNPIADGMEVLLKGAVPPATLRLTPEQWKTFRPLAVLTPLAPQE